MIHEPHVLEETNRQKNEDEIEGGPDTLTVFSRFFSSAIRDCLS